ncbi:hypothetical protein [Gordonia sp. FQ]|uniref:hypothetical protein n=1 Tax=Gordonia sp. FQ TaxID=3446634 RepID=UPI003F84981F
MGDVESIEYVWRDRARVASEAADELEDLANQLSTTMVRNSFGVGCVEGDVLFGRLCAIRDSTVTAFHTQATRAREVADRCLAAAAAYEAADGASAAEVGTS